MALQNLLGDLALEGSMQQIAQYLEQIASSIGRVYPDTSGRTRINVETGTLSGLNAVGGYNMQYDQYSQCMVGAEAVRNKIVVS